MATPGLSAATEPGCPRRVRVGRLLTSPQTSTLPFPVPRLPSGSPPPLPLTSPLDSPLGWTGGDYSYWKRRERDVDCCRALLSKSSSSSSARRVPFSTSPRLATTVDFPLRLDEAGGRARFKLRKSPSRARVPAQSPRTGTDDEPSSPLFRRLNRVRRTSVPSRSPGGISSSDAAAARYVFSMTS